MTAPKEPEPLRRPDFARFWTADAISTLGIFTTTVAVDVLIIQVLQASESEVGLIRAVQFLPYLMVGLLAGALVDRWKRRPITLWLTVGVFLLAVVLIAFSPLRGARANAE